MDGRCRSLPTEIVYSILKCLDPGLPLLLSRFVLE